MLSEVGMIRLFFQNPTMIWLTFVRAQFFKFFGKEKICFFLSCEYIWRVDVFNGVLIYIESCLSHIFQIAHYFWIFTLLFIDPTPFFFIVTANKLNNSPCNVIYGVFLTDHKLIPYTVY